MKSKSWVEKGSRIHRLTYTSKRDDFQRLERVLTALSLDSSLAFPIRDSVGTNTFAPGRSRVNWWAVVDCRSDAASSSSLLLLCGVKDSLQPNLTSTKRHHAPHTTQPRNHATTQTYDS